MTLDELAATVASTSPDPVVQRLASLLVLWKDDDTSVQALRNDVERYIGNTWIELTEVHKTVYALWSEFVNTAINSIGGMTMDERLFFFDLASEFDLASTDEQRERIYAKLLARP
jgi:hypothetical protein